MIAWHTILWFLLLHCVGGQGDDDKFEFTTPEPIPLPFYPKCSYGEGIRANSDWCSCGYATCPPEHICQEISSQCHALKACTSIDGTGASEIECNCATDTPENFKLKEEEREAQKVAELLENEEAKEAVANNSTRRLRGIEDLVSLYAEIKEEEFLSQNDDYESDELLSFSERYYNPEFTEIAERRMLEEGKNETQFYLDILDEMTKPKNPDNRVPSKTTTLRCDRYEVCNADELHCAKLENCTDSFATRVLPGACTCGTAQCAAHDYCYAQSNTCFQMPLCTTVVNATLVVDRGCMCGTSRCARNDICHSYNDTCIPMTNCTNTEGLVNVENQCKCGAKICYPDQLCNITRNSCDWPEEERLTYTFSEIVLVAVVMFATLCSLIFCIILRRLMAKQAHLKYLAKLELDRLRAERRKARIEAGLMNEESSDDEEPPIEEEEEEEDVFLKFLSPHALARQRAMSLFSNQVEEHLPRKTSNPEDESMILSLIAKQRLSAGIDSVAGNMKPLPSRRLSTAEIAAPSNSKNLASRLRRHSSIIESTESPTSRARKISQFFTRRNKIANASQNSPDADVLGQGNLRTNLKSVLEKVNQEEEEESSDNFYEKSSDNTSLGSGPSRSNSKSSRIQVKSMEEREAIPLQIYQIQEDEEEFALSPAPPIQPMTERDNETIPLPMHPVRSLDEPESPTSLQLMEESDGLEVEELH